MGHILYRSSCRHCVAARAVGQAHTAADSLGRGDDALPEFATDYYFFGEEGKVATHSLCKDTNSRAIHSTSLDSKTS
eukprot:29357-Karenia_brevis.AAC.1